MLIEPAPGRVEEPRPYPHHRLDLGVPHVEVAVVHKELCAVLLLRDRVVRPGRADAADAAHPHLPAVRRALVDVHLTGKLQGGFQGKPLNLLVGLVLHVPPPQGALDNSRPVPDHEELDPAAAPAVVEPASHRDKLTVVPTVKDIGHVDETSHLRPKKLPVEAVKIAFALRGSRIDGA